MPQSSTLGIKGQVAALGLPWPHKALVQCSCAQSMHRGLPCTTMGVCASPGYMAGCGCCRTRASMSGSWIGAPGLALCATVELWGTIPVLVGTITKHCVDSLHRGQRLASWLQLWALYTALVFSSATPQPIGVSSSWHWLSHPISPNIHPQPQQCQGLQVPHGIQGHSPVPAAARKTQEPGGQ